MQIASCRSSGYIARVAYGLCVLLVLADVSGQTPPAASQKTPVPAKKDAAPQSEAKSAKGGSGPAKAPGKAMAPVAPVVDSAEDVAAADAEEKKERVTADRYLVVLEKNPRRGTALDKVYGFHVERGSLDQWLQQYRDRVARQDDDGTAWLMLGLIEAHRGQDAAAAKALQKAEQYLPESAISSYYLGQSLILVGQPELAAAALERALDRKPAQADLLESFQALGRVYQRAQQSEKALAVWERLEKLFPNDLRVQEQIAVTLAEEGQAALALPRFEALAAKSTKDLYRQSQFKIQVAEIKIRLGRSKEGLADFEKLLEQLNPDNWLYRDVRHKIDEVFLRSDDQAGLVTYYEGWVAKHPDDVDAMARLSRILAALGRAPEAQVWLEKGLKLAPSRKELRMAIIDQLVYDQKYPEAIQQYALLDQHEPNNPDTIRDWGRLILKDTTHPEAERKLAATTLWKKLLNAKPKDPVVATQVADLFRHAELNDEALALYKKAVELAPEAAQYREYLGEYYHQLKRPDEALAIWREIAAGKNRTSPNLTRLGEVLIGFGYLAEGTAALAEAVKLDPQEFDLQLRLAKALNQGEKYDDALTSLAAAEKLVTNPEEAEIVLQLKLVSLQAADKLTAEIEALEKELTAPVGDATQQAGRWYLLARSYEMDRKQTEALRSALKSLELNPQSIPALSATARIQESANSLLEAAETNRRLAAVDRRFRTQYLTQVARLEARLGRKAESLKAGREVLASAPGNPDSYEFFAQLCFQLGENDEGLETLRRSVRVNPSEPKVVLALASALAEQFKTAEAIELYWRAFEKNADIEGKLDAISKLTELYLQTNHLDRMLDRLDRARREDLQQQRVMTLCIAQTHQSAGDFGSARVELERMLTPETRDTSLLQQLAKLAESEGDYQFAIKYQEQLNKLSPKREGLLQLAHLLMQSGDSEQASQLQLKVLLEEKDPERLLKNLDMLLQRDQGEQALQVTERLLRDEPRNWEYLYREGVALFSKQPEKAEERFQQILALTLADDELSQAAKAKLKQAAGQKSISVANGGAVNPAIVRSSQRSQAANMLRYITGFDSRYRYSSGSSFWAPENYGNARMAALAWLLSIAQKKGQEEAFVNAHRQAWEQAKTSSRAAWDWYYLQLLQSDPDAIHQAAKSLLSLPGATNEAQLIYVQSLASRGQQNPRVAVARRSASKTEDTVAPLPPEEIEFLLKLYRSKPLAADAQSADGSNVYSRLLTSQVITELTRAKRTDEAKQILDDAIASATTAPQIVPLLNKAASDGDYDQVMKLWDTLDRVQAASADKKPVSVATTMSPLMARRAVVKSYPDILKLLDRSLLAEYRARQHAAPLTKNKKKPQYNPYGVGQPVRYQIYGANNVTTAVVSFPLPNAYFGFTDLQLLRNAFALYQEADLMTDLVQHFETVAQRAETPVAERLPWRLGLAYLHWWNDSQDLAIEQLKEIAQSMPEDHEFQLDLAEVLATRKEYAQGLELVDSIVPLNQEILQRREKLALQMAFSSGQTDRAREAAGRLFGLRLDAETQVQLASQMKQLGMHDQAEAMMARAGRQAGNRLSALLSLMQEFQTQGKPETALQIAQTILRRTQPQLGNQRTQAQEEVIQARKLALEFLVNSGKLPELIVRVEAQLKNSPKSIQLHQSLIEYYTASGNKEQAQKCALRLAEMNLNDPQARWQVAMQLLKSGATDKALEHMRAALKQQPRLFSNQYWEIQSAFRQAKKTADLVKLLDEIDLKAIGQSYSVMNIVQEMMNEESGREVGMKLFRRAWESFPNERAQMLSSIHQDQLWQAPEMYGYAKEAFVPKTSAQVRGDPWSGFDVRSYHGAGIVSGSLGHLLLAAKKQNKLPELEREITESLEKHPAWRGGRAMLGIIILQRGEHDKALQILEEVLANKDQGLPVQAAWLIGQELNSIAKGEALATRFYEYAANETTLGGISEQFEYSPGYSLVAIYIKNGQKDLARQMLLKALVDKSSGNYYDANYAAYQRLQNQNSIGARLQELGFAIDSLRIYEKMSADQEGMALANSVSGDSYKERAETGIQNALKAIRPEQLAEEIRKRLPPSDGDPKNISPKDGSPKDSELPVVDFFLTLEPRSGEPTRLSGLMIEILGKAAQIPAMQAEITESLTRLQALRPDDISIPIAAAFLARNEAKPELFAKAVEQLDAWVAAHPLEAVDPKKVANARQRTQAERRIALWLIARECLRRAPFKAIGARLEAHVLAAARRQGNKEFALAIVNEQGQIAWDGGDKATAEARWSEALDLICSTAEVAVAKPSPPQASPSKSSPVAAPVSTGNAEQPKLLPGVAPTTLNQVKQILELAKLGATNGLHDFSFQAARRAFRGGPPIAEPKTAPSQGVVRSRSSQPSPSNDVAIAVEKGMWELQRLWTKHHAPDDQAYALLAEVVFPAARPEEIMIYARPLPGEDDLSPRSVGQTLVKRAILAHQENDLKEKIAQRQSSAAGAFHGQLLLTMLAIESHDIPAAKAAIEELAKKFEQRPLQDSAELVCQIAEPALDEEVLAVAALPLLARAVKQLAAMKTTNARGIAENRYAALQLKLAALSFTHGNAAAGKAILADYVTGQDALYQDYGGDYGQFMHKQTLQKITGELVKVGQLEEALQRLGEIADMPKFEQYGRSNNLDAGPKLLKQLQELPAAERYRILKAWTLPVEGRKTLRMIDGFGLQDEAPRNFIANLFGAAGVRAVKRGLLSSAKLLVQSAQEVDKLDELAAAIQPLADQKLEGAAELLTLIQSTQKKEKEAAPASK